MFALGKTLFKEIFMITLKMMGGLGNQMFIYAYGKRLSMLGHEIQFDSSSYSYTNKTHRGREINTIRNLEILDFYLSPFTFINQPGENILISKLQKLYHKIFSPKNITYEKDIKDLFKISKNSYIQGHFINASLVEDIREELLKDFVLKSPISSQNQSWKEKILSTPNSVFIHIRRGDYLLSHHWNFVKLGQAYYNSAISILQTKLLSPHFFIFSNDIQWCKKHIGLFSGLSSKNTTFIEGNHEGMAIEELELMRNCKHGIMANSTFSWWAGFLLRNPQKICIFPTQFLYNPDQDVANQLIPLSEKWYLIDPIWGENINKIRRTHETQNY